jgi:small subunit ribosomal protein S18
MARKNTKEKPGGNRRSAMGTRIQRPKPKIEFTIDAIDFKNVTLLRQFVTDQGRILPRKYTGMSAQYQRRVTSAIKRARQALLMK